jgi:transcriptional regulator with XRE-family HTH domain
MSTLEFVFMELFSSFPLTIGMENKQNMPRIDMAGVGRRLEALREALGLSRKDFSDTFGLDASSYGKTAKGEKQLRSDAAYAISELWGVSMDYLFRGRLTDLPSDIRPKILKNLNTGEQ